MKKIKILFYLFVFMSIFMSLDVIKEYFSSKYNISQAILMSFGILIFMGIIISLVKKIKTLA